MSVPTVSKPPPGRGWYIFAGLLLIAAAAGGGLFILKRVTGLSERLIQVVVPGTADLDLREAGSYTIFHEYRSVVDGTVYYAISLSGLRIAIRSPQGTEVKLISPMATSRYSVSGRAGVSVLTFDVPEPGLYKLSAVYENGRAEPRTVLAIGSGFVAAILETVFIALGIAFFGIGGSILIFVWVGRARSPIRAARRLT